MDSSPNGRTSFWTRTPAVAKVLMLVETAVILLLSTWLYEEYLNNPYLQSYVSIALQTEAVTFGIASVVSVVAMSVLAILWKSRAPTLKSTTLRAMPRSSRVSGDSQTSRNPEPKQETPAVSSPLHPVVAALKAELQGTSLPAGVQISPREVKSEAGSASAAKTETSAPPLASRPAAPSALAPSSNSQVSLKAEGEKSTDQKSTQTTA